jgi:hypothetical protein
VVLSSRAEVSKLFTIRAELLLNSASSSQRRDAVVAEPTPVE